MDQKRIDELGIELGRSLAAVVQHALSIAAQSLTKPVETEKADLLAIKEIGQKIMAYKGENPWVEEECAKAMGGRVLATLRESEIQPAYDALVKILNKLEGNEEPNDSVFA